jgi:hypothetical protein
LTDRIVHEEKIIEILQFLDKDFCNDLIDYLEGNSQKGDDNSWAPICFPGVLGANVGEPVATEKISASTMGELRQKFHEALESVLGRRVKNVTMSGHKFPTGSYAKPHSDSSEIDGTPNAWQMNKYATILYLNDNYGGGEIYFPQHEIEISPQAGSLLLFEGSHEYLHGVKEITFGNRYTILAFWDNEESVYDKEFLDQKVVDQKIALDYVENAYKDKYGEHASKSFGLQKAEDLYSFLGKEDPSVS